MYGKVIAFARLVNILKSKQILSYVSLKNTLKHRFKVIYYPSIY